MRVVWFLCCLLLLAFPVRAEKADKSKPVNVEADSVRVEDKKKTAVYEGHVVLTQGTLMMTADRIDVQQDDQGFSSGDASGKPVYFRQKMEGRDEFAEGWAERIVYDSNSDKLKLSGQARLKRGDEELRGSLITYDAKSEFYQAQGSSEGVRGRVRAVILPKGSVAKTVPLPAGKAGQP
ncbi:MAG: lipopolysaccharide transport periplasmic protein LptA [Hydrogenophilales bacterium 28-61-23]|nr:MAG: lipopolysaccharide transport periplasmic protein LptA [Hydrogenophilales bacterium 28-61-23]